MPEPRPTVRLRSSSTGRMKGRAPNGEKRLVPAATLLGGTAHRKKNG